MNDDLHKTYEPESVPGEPGVEPPANDGWKMPQPVFRRSTGRVGGASGDVPKAPSTIVPERLRKKEAEPENVAETPPPDVEPQPDFGDLVEPEQIHDLDVSDLRAPEPVSSKLHFGIVAVVIVALIGIVSALAVAIYLGYIVWR